MKGERRMATACSNPGCFRRSWATLRRQMAAKNYICVAAPERSTGRRCPTQAASASTGCEAGTKGFLIARATDNRGFLQLALRAAAPERAL